LLRLITRAIQIVQVGRRKGGRPSSGTKGTKVGAAAPANTVEHHPLRFVAGLHERLDELQALRPTA